VSVKELAGVKLQSGGKGWPKQSASPASESAATQAPLINCS